MVINTAVTVQRTTSPTQAALSEQLARQQRTKPHNDQQRGKVSQLQPCGSGMGISSQAQIHNSASARIVCRAVRARTGGWREPRSAEGAAAAVDGNPAHGRRRVERRRGPPNRAQRRWDARRTRLPVRRGPRRLGLEAQPDEGLVLPPVRLPLRARRRGVICGALVTGSGSMSGPQRSQAHAGAIARIPTPRASLRNVAAPHPPAPRRLGPCQPGVTRRGQLGQCRGLHLCPTPDPRRERGPEQASSRYVPGTGQGWGRDPATRSR
jgi:hypothetical protein